jgi:hypothetical protein
MKIGFCGAQGTGKTSVAEILIKDPDMIDRNWKFVPSTARVAMSEGYALNRDADELSQLLTTCSRIVAEFNTEDDITSVFSDRTPLDSLAYTAYQFSHVWNASSKFYWDISNGIVKKHMMEYDKLFYFPVLWAPVADGDRDPDVGYQQSIDHYIVSFLEVFGLKYEIIPGTTPQQRAEFVKGCIFN